MYYFLTKTQQATLDVDKFLGRSLSWECLEDGRYVTELEPGEHWEVAHSDIEGLEPYGSPTPQYAIRLSHRDFINSGYYSGTNGFLDSMVVFESDDKPYKIYSTIEEAEKEALTLPNQYHLAVENMATRHTVSRFIRSENSWKRF